MAAHRSQAPRIEDAPRVSVVIPNWNGIDRLDGVLRSLEAQSFRDFETIVVDNGSRDGSIEHLRRAWPEVGVLGLDSNRGFGAAVNAGIERGRGEFFALVNNDVELEAGWLEAAVRALERRPRAASVASKLLNWNQREVLDGAGDMAGWDGYCIRRGQGQRDNGQYQRERLVLSACAAAALYRRIAYADVGPFDESFFAYIEDVDWGLRAQLAGWDCHYEPTAVAYHVGGATASGIPGFELYQCHRNTIALMVKDFPLTGLALFVPWALLRRGGSLGKAVARGHARLLLRAWLDAGRRLPESMRARREIQRRRKRGYQDLVHVMRPAYPPRAWRARP